MIPFVEVEESAAEVLLLKVRGADAVLAHVTVHGQRGGMADPDFVATEDEFVDLEAEFKGKAKEW